MWRWLFLIVLPFSATFGGVSLSWTDNSDNEDGFRIERRRPDGQFVEIARTGKDVNYYEDLSAEEGEIYEYRVNAFNSFGYSGYTNVSQAIVLLKTPSEVEAGMTQQAR